MLSTCFINKDGSSQVIKNIQKNAIIMEPLLDSSVSLFQGYFFSHLWVPTAYGCPVSRVPSFKGYDCLLASLFSRVFGFPLFQEHFVVLLLVSLFFGQESIHSICKGRPWAFSSAISCEPLVLFPFGLNGVAVHSFLKGILQDVP